MLQILRVTRFLTECARGTLLTYSNTEARQAASDPNWRNKSTKSTKFLVPFAASPALIYCGDRSHVTGTCHPKLIRNIYVPLINVKGELVDNIVTLPLSRYTSVLTQTKIPKSYHAEYQQWLGSWGAGLAS